MTLLGSIGMKGSLRKQYEEALVASGLVDDVPDVMALDPMPRRFSEGEYICKRGDKADRLWVIVSGSVAVRDEDKTLYIRHRPEVVGEQNTISKEGFRWYDLVANESQVEVLAIRRQRIEQHESADALWRNIAKIISLKLKTATVQTANLLEQVRNDTRILEAYTNEYALSRRLRSGSQYLTDHKIENAVVWFSDIVNFTQYVLKLSPTRTADLVQRFFNAQAEAIENHGGFVDKFMGDGLMAFWILPSYNRENVEIACFNALSAAKEAVTSVSQIRVGAEPLELRIGLHVGQVLSGDFGSAHRHQFTLIGATVNMSAQLEQIRGDEVSDSGRKVDPIRMSAEFHDSLPLEERQRCGEPRCAITRKMGKLTLFCAIGPAQT